MEGNREKLVAMSLPITDRELAILSVAITEMQRAGHLPFEDQFFVQVVSWFHWLNFPNQYHSQIYGKVAPIFMLFPFDVNCSLCS